MPKLKSEEIEQRYWSLAEIAKELKVHPGTIRSWEMHGVLKPSKTGKKGNPKVLYRKYNKDGYNRIMTIAALRGFGVTLRLIVTLLKEGNANDLLVFLEKKKEEAERKKNRTMYPYFG